MPITVENDEGKEVQAFTAEELEAEKAKIQAEADAKVAAAEAHTKTKLDEFMKGKQGVELKEQEFNAKIEEAKKMSETATAKVEEERQARFGALKNYIFEQYGGNDPETKKKLEEAWDLVNVPITNEDDVKRRVKLSADLAGLSNGPKMEMNYGMPVGGGYAPQFNKPVSDAAANHDKFLNELGLQDLKKPQA